MPTLQEQAGLHEAGKNEEGETEYIGTKKQWEKFEELQGEHDCHTSPEDGCAGCEQLTN